MKEFTASCSGQIEQLKQALETADAVLIGAGSGLSTSAGLTYSGERFERYFSDFHQKYGITDIYSGGFYPFDTLEEYWAWWSRHISITAIHRAKEEFELPEYQELLKELGVDGEWEGIGHCAVGYVDGEIPKAAKRKDNRVFWVD